MTFSNVVYDIQVSEGSTSYRASYFVEGDLLYVMGPGVTQIMQFGGLPPEIGAKLILQSWIHLGRIPAQFRAKPDQDSRL